MDNPPITLLVKQAVTALDPNAEVILYGSRARGTNSANSDWDFLIITGTCAHRELKQKMRRSIYEIEWATSEVISVVIRNRQEWDLPILQSSPFHINIDHEGLRL